MGAWGPMGVLRDDLDRRIVRLAIPALGTLAVEPLYVLVDTAIVGRISTDALAGLAIAATVLLTVVSLATFLEYGVTPDVAFAHGAGRRRRRPPGGHRRAHPGGHPRHARRRSRLALAARPLCWLLGGRGAGAGVRRAVPADQRGRPAVRAHRARRPRGDARRSTTCASR